MRFIARCTAVVIILGLVGCSGTTAPNIKEQGSLLTSIGKTTIESVRAGRVEPPNPYKIFTRKLIDSSEEPVLLAKVEDRETYGTLFPAQTNKEIVTWRTADNITLSFKQGVVVASRGLGGDLMAADVRDVVSGVARANGEGVRIHDSLDGEDQSVRNSFYCTYRSKGLEKIVIFDIAYTLNRVAETCKSPTITIENDYWGSPSDGMYRQSRQWLGPDVGYVFLQQLTR
jgi:hypothetical protein